MSNWKQILYDIYTPEIASIWAAPNGIWNNSFAHNKAKIDFHPSIVGKISSCNTYCQIIPGTSKDYRKGSCVFKVKLNTSSQSSPISYFLIDLWMTLSKKDLLSFKNEWNGVTKLNETQLKDFKLQIKYCNGIDV